MTDPSLDREFSVNINLGGITAPTGMGNTQVPEGYYRAVVDDMYVNPDRNPNRVVIKLKLTDAPFAGVIRTDGLNLPKTEEDKVRFYWRALAESAGYTAAQLDAGEITLGRGSFHGKQVFIHYNPKDSATNTTGWDRTFFLAPAVWNQKKQSFDAQPPKPTLGVKPPVGSSLGGPVKSDAGVVTSGDVMKRLGLSS